MFTHRTRKHSAAIVMVALLLTISAAAQTGGRPDFTNVRIKNFGRTDDNYFRGAQPQGRDYSDLAALGVRTVIDLTRDGRADEEAFVRQAGMKFYRIPLTTTERPSDEAVAQFLKLVSDPANLPVFVHCQGGRHRTGVMTAVYRITKEGWNPDRAYQEMKQYHFEGFPGHPVLKQFVYDYYTTLAEARQKNDERLAHTSTF